MRISPLLLVLLVVALLGGCERRKSEERATALTGGGNPHAGRQAIRKYGCQTCHTIHGVPGARGMVGPPLDTVGNRYVIAGELPNTPENLMHWIQHPHQVEPHTMMPEMGVTEQDSRDIAAYLYSLRY